MQRAHWNRRSVRHHELSVRAGGEHERRLPGTGKVGLHGTPRDLHLGGVRVDFGDLDVSVEQDDVLDLAIVQPWSFDGSRRREVAQLLVGEDDTPAAVHGDVVDTVGAGKREPQLRLSEDMNAHTAQRRAVRLERAAAHE